MNYVTWRSQVATEQEPQSTVMVTGRHTNYSKEATAGDVLS